jgi:hypothetical protein
MLAGGLGHVTPMRILQGVAVLRERGYHRIRAHLRMRLSGE